MVAAGDNGNSPDGVEIYSISDDNWRTGNIDFM